MPRTRSIPGFDHRNVAVVSIDLRGPRYEKGNAAIFHEQWLERVRALPGVERVAQASRIPLSPGRSQTTFRLGDEPEGHVVDVNTVSPEFFSMLGMPIVRGRVFTDGEADAALVTESTARRYWPGQDAIGRAIIMDGRRRQIVGIVRDAQVSQAQEAVSSYLYLPAARGAQRSISVLARTRVRLRWIRGGGARRDVSHGCESRRERAAAVGQPRDCCRRCRRSRRASPAC